MKRMFWKYALLISLVLILPIEGVAQSELQNSPAYQSLLQRRDRGEVSSEFVTDVEKEAGELQSKGLPVEPYLLKANEGAAKRVPPKKIYPALKTSKQQTEVAGELFEKAAGKEGFQGSAKNREEGIVRFQRELMTGKKPSKVERSAEDYVKQKKVEKKDIHPREEMRSPKPKEFKQKGGSTTHEFKKSKRVEKPQEYKIERGPKSSNRINEGGKIGPKGNSNGRKK